VPTAVRTPPALPAPYQTLRLNPLDQPVGYLEDTCQYLKSKWDPANAAPGTIVIPIMFHAIPASETSDPNEISQYHFEKMIADLQGQGFEAITVSQLADFLEANARIPARSFVMILDDRRPGTAYTTFLPVLEANNWRMSLAWPIGYGDDTTDRKPATFVTGDPLSGTYPDLWAQIEHYYESGRFEVESHGYYHNLPMSDESSDVYLRQELEQSMAELEAHFGRRPVAIIWPGGGFARRPVEFARSAGYRLGFTINPRGPLMFNWIPQAQARDPLRPIYLPEGPAGDPLLTLPRYWPSQVSGELDNIRLMGKEAAAHADASRATELEYYDLACAATHGPLPAP
jgi:peptidoglycan/xylan/chitin deacetylase (PgdA/CDA1 family)